MTVIASAQQITERILAVQASLPATVTLVAVTKQLPVEVIRIAYAAGVRHFGESRVQEAIAKQADLQDYPDITWHLIGHLQTNKARKAVEHFQWIHSVDSLKLAERLNQVAAELNQRPHCCLQVKMVPDPPKTGFERSELEAALPTLNQLTHLDLCGLMAIPPQNSSPEEIQHIFSAAKQLADQIRQSDFLNLNIHQLSLGMSRDYPLALAAGSTLIRLGTTIFGPRS
ncbi:MAG: YggS family pyridoxal phosphate-dependent enzyme [Leptolyngbya sp.]|nr:YggS family pyridoxal phosphate-dependent enzyme [Leptolyngbya sp.]